jgi:hypothetical protein
MQLMRYDFLADGPGPSEKIIAIATTDGKEEIVLHSSALVGRDSIEVGVVGYKDDKALVELPRESASGRWRVWVHRSALAVS